MDKIRPKYIGYNQHDDDHQEHFPEILKPCQCLLVDFTSDQDAGAHLNKVFEPWKYCSSSGKNTEKRHHKHGTDHGTSRNFQFCKQVHTGCCDHEGQEKRRRLYGSQGFYRG